MEGEWEGVGARVEEEWVEGSEEMEDGVEQGVVVEKGFKLVVVEDGFEWEVEGFEGAEMGTGEEGIKGSEEGVEGEESSPRWKSLGTRGKLTSIVSCLCNNKIN